MRFYHKKSIELLQFSLEDVFLPKDRWMSLPQKPIRARSEMARGDAAGRASRGCPSILCCFSSSAGWGTSTDNMHPVMRSQQGGLCLPGSKTETDQMFVFHFIILKFFRLTTIKLLTQSDAMSKTRIVYKLSIKTIYFPNMTN